ncbi:MAG: hypothetical protein KTR14_04190 [Vampirovibrio sp.]|nr:hypothetical protein [Vampirovibrio sp.]
MVTNAAGVTNFQGGPFLFNSPTVNTGPTSGNVFEDRSSSFLSPRTINGVTDDFSNSINPVTSNNLQAQLFNPNPFTNNPQQLNVLNTTNSGISTAFGLGNGALTNSVFGPQVAPNADLFNFFGSNPSSVDILGRTNFFTGLILPTGFGSQLSFGNFGGNNGFNSLFNGFAGPILGVPTFGGFNSGNVFGGNSFGGNVFGNSAFGGSTLGNTGFTNTGFNNTGFGGTGFGNTGFSNTVPAIPFMMVPTSGFNPGFNTGNTGFNTGFNNGFNSGFGGNALAGSVPVQSFNQSTIGGLPFTEFILQNFTGADFPDLLPGNLPGDPSSLLWQFANASAETQETFRTAYANPTVVDDAILADTGITSTGGIFDQGTVTNPFLQAGFLTDTNPLAKFNSGMLVTNGNGNGNVLGTLTQDTIFGQADDSNIINGQGGLDSIIGGDDADLVNVAQGDKLDARDGDDVMFFNFDATANPFNFQSMVNGGAGTDTMVIAIDADPTVTENLPTFQNIGNGMMRVTLNEKVLYTAAVERYLITDQDGNIGSILEPTSTGTTV